MKNKTTQQEILLVTTTTLSKRQFCEKYSADKSNRILSPIEQLEEACWNGLLDEMLPEIMNRATTGKHLYLWHVRQGKNSLQMELSELPVYIEKPFSINTHLFLSTLFYN